MGVVLMHIRRSCFFKPKFSLHPMLIPNQRVFSNFIDNSKKNTEETVGQKLISNHDFCIQKCRITFNYKKSISLLVCVILSVENANIVMGSILQNF